MADSEPLPQVSISDCNPVPVFNCHIAMKRDPSSGRITGRVANLHGLEASGTSERDILKSLARQFKDAVQKQMESETGSVDLIESPVIEDDEFERFLPIHL